MTAIEIAHGIRAVAQQFYPRCPTLRNRCGPCSFALMTCICGLGHDAALAWGFYGARKRPHYWVETGENILDLTAGQFHRGQGEPVLIAALDDPRYDGHRLFRDSDEASRGGMHALAAIDGFAIAMLFTESLGQRREIA